MMNFLPIIYDDEILFSVISRYKQMCGMVSKQALEEDLFNQRRNMNTSVLFPQEINTLVQNFPPNSQVTVREVIINQTLYPFYTAFLSEQRSEEIYRGMAKGHGKGFVNLLGIAGSKIKTNDLLKFCPSCLHDDMEHLGESYWRRLHQIPGALYCIKHQVSLRNSKIIITDSRVDFYCADEDVCPDQNEENIYPPIIQDLNLTYIRNASFLLSENQKRKDLTFIINFYIDQLREKGFASKVGSVYIKELLEAFVQFYPSQYLELMQSSIDVDKETNWVRLFIRNNNKNRSPLRHLLFMQFLGIDVKELFEVETVTGKQTIQHERAPHLELDKKRKEWLKLIQDNLGASRSKLKNIGKALHTWLYVNDRPWYDKVTPIEIVKRKRKESIDWEKRDNECLLLANKAVEMLMKKEGKPIRIIPSNIRRVIGVRRWFHHKKLVKTGKYLKEITEDLESYRIRKINWAIDELKQQEGSITVYKIQLYAGFGGSNRESKQLIEKVLIKVDLLKENQ
ncbi:TnsD family Tn7-like transposition protein [Brevibacillus brevis]|uniref:TnsD family Tn7-like transposition protein n=1 Tax=Brevibacillus brevis TaxID=1393 RepID=UPI0037C80F66